MAPAARQPGPRVARRQSGQVQCKCRWHRICPTGMNLRKREFVRPGRRHWARDRDGDWPVSESRATGSGCVSRSPVAAIRGEQIQSLRFSVDDCSRMAPEIVADGPQVLPLSGPMPAQPAPRCRTLSGTDPAPIRHSGCGPSDGSRGRGSLAPCKTGRPQFPRETNRRPGAAAGLICNAQNCTAANRKDTFITKQGATNKHLVDCRISDGEARFTKYST